MSVSDDLLDSIRRTADMPFDEARTLPREAYTDPEFAVPGSRPAVPGELGLFRSHGRDS